MSTTIRAFDPAHDRAAVRAGIVELQEFERVLEPSLPQGEGMADAYLETIFERVAKHSGRVFVAEVERTVVGFVAILGRVEPEASDEEQILHAYVSDLVVLPAYRNRGLGRRLLDAAEQFARALGTKRLDISVLSKNPAAARLYRDFGFGDFRIQLAKRLD